MAINFPDSPNNGDIYTVNGKKWIYEDGKWASYGLALAPDVLKVDSVNNRVGVNNLSPTVDLDVTGSAAISGSLTVDGDITVSGNTTTLNTTELYVEDNKITLNSGATGSATVNAGIEVERGDDPNVEILWDETADAWKIATDFTVDTDTLHVDSTNNRVGIGTTSPAYTVDVVGPSTAGTAIHTAGTLYVNSTQNWNYGSLTLQRDASNTSSSKAISFPFEADSTADTNLYNYPNIILRTDSAPTTGSTAAALNAGIEITAPDTVRLGTNGAERMRVDSSGNVGIGTSGPLQMLHVNGMILADMGDNGYGFERSGTQSSWALRKGGTGSLSGDAVMIGNVNNNYLEFWTNNTRHGFMRSDGALYMTAVYGDTNAAGANMVILSSGQIMRSTSSAKYKTDIETLDEQHADLIYDLRPVWYRSTIETDIEGYSYYGLLAEEVAEVDPRLVHFGASLDCSCVAPEGEHLEHTKECLSEPEGVQYDRIVPHLISVAQRQKETIDQLVEQIDALTARIEALEAG